MTAGTVIVHWRNPLGVHQCAGPGWVVLKTAKQAVANYATLVEFKLKRNKFRPNAGEVSKGVFLVPISGV